MIEGETISKQRWKLAIFRFAGMAVSVNDNCELDEHSKKVFIEDLELAVNAMTDVLSQGCKINYIPFKDGAFNDAMEFFEISKKDGANEEAYND